MPVNDVHEAYQEAAKRWERCRDCYLGSDAVKARGDTYLPRLDSHRSNIGSQSYGAYKKRALFFAAVARTVDGLAGGIFQKAPDVRVPPDIEPHLSDITLTDETLELFALRAAKEVLITGRYGILVDVATEPEVGPARPYWSAYAAENIVNWETSRRGGDERLVRVVLLETVNEPGDDRFTRKPVTQYRVLELDEQGRYIVSIWRRRTTSTTTPGYEPVPIGSDGDDSQSYATMPTRRGKPLNFIPFVFLGPTSVSPAVAKPPLIDLVDVNISHYQTSADLEHGRHRTALPTPWVAGVPNDGDPLWVGADVAWKLPQGATAGMLEFTGQGLGALEKADEQKRKMMAVLGARLLEDSPERSFTETATGIVFRHAGEQATLRTLAQAIETGFTLALRWHAWWASSAQTPGDTGALMELNKDFSTLRMSPQELQAHVQALQGGGMSFKTFWSNLERGGLTRPGVTAEEEQEEIRKDGRPSE